MFAYNKFQVQLSGVTEWLVSNIATRISIHTYKFWTASKTSAITHFRLSERLTSLRETQFEKRYVRSSSGTDVENIKKNTSEMH